MGQGSRPDRVADQIRAEVADALTRELHDPGIGFVTITRVAVSPDLQHARVFYTSLGDLKARQETARALERAAGFLRRRISQRLRLRHAPELRFEFDEGMERQNRVEQLLHEIAEQRAGAPAEPETDAPEPDKH